MIVQTRRDVLRLMTQHDHGLLSGKLAQHYVGFGDGEERLSFELVIACAFHDFAWRDVDREPRLNGETGGPFDFERYPEGDRARFYAKGLDEVARLHPYAALLGSFHYCTFMQGSGQEAFLENEERRREALMKEFGYDRKTVDRDRLWLRLFDNLSLYVCMTGKGVEGAPSWLDPERLGRTPLGQRFQVSWIDSDDSPDVGRLAFTPFPFDGPMRVSVPYREIERRSWTSERELAEDFSRAGIGSLECTICGR